MRLVREIEARTPAPIPAKVCALGAAVGLAVDDAEGGPGAKQRYTLLHEARRAVRELQYWFRLLVETDCATPEDIAPFVLEARRLYPLLVAACAEAQRARDEKHG